MTVTVVFGKTSDGYLWNYDPSYATARNGPAEGVNNGTSGFVGQNNNSSQYANFQSFIGFDYPAIPDTERVTAAMIRVKPASVLAPSIATELYAIGYAWSPGGLVVGDWRTPTQLNAASNRIDAQWGVINQANGKHAFAGSDEFLAAMIPVVSMEHVVVTNRQRSGTTPTSDEGISIWMSDLAGTSDDPALIYTSAPRSTLYGVMGAQVQLSDGTWAFLESNGAVAPTITLKHETAAGTQTTIATIPIGTTSADFFTPGGAQALALVCDAADNLYVFGRVGNAENNLAGKAYVKGVGLVWTAQATRSAAMPTISTAINQVVAAYHTTAGGAIHCIVGHTNGPAHPTTTTGVMNASVNAAHLRTGAGAFMLGSGSVSNSLMPFVNYSGRHNTYPNEVGSGMDVAPALGGNPDWGFFYGFQHGQIPGDNDELASARYILNATATSLSHATSEPGLGWGRKDAAGKVRVVPISPTTACFVSTDADAGWSLTVYVQQHTGTDAGSVTLAGDAIGSEGIASFPDGPALAQSSAWDCIYNATENKLWIYYVNALDSTQVMRTGFDLTTMKYDRAEVLIYDATSGTTIQGIRVERNKPVTQTGLVSIARVNAGVYALVTITDTFNLAPTAPTLVPRANYDATVAAIFDWSFNDPNAGDTQSAYQLEISRVDNGVVALDTGKVASTTSERSVAGGTLTNSVDYRWRVRTYDALDAVSPWSSYSTFSTSAGGSVTVTNPPTDNLVGVVTDDYPISWNVTGTVQAAYRVILFKVTGPNTLSTVSDTGWVASTATTHTVSGMVSDVEHEVWVQVRNASLVLSGYGKRKITPSFAVPETPTISVNANAEGGHVLVSVENPAPGAPTLGLPEEDFEGGVAGWGPSGGTFVQSNEQAHRGTFSGKMTVVGTPTQMYVRPAQAAVVGGQRLTVRMWAYRPVAGAMQCSIDWFDAAHAYISTSAAQSNLEAATWTSVQGSGTAPTNAAFASYGPTLAGNPANGTVMYVDEVVLTGASDRPDVTRNEILRRPLGETGDWEVVGECGPDGSFYDYTAGAGLVYEYIARGIA